MNDDDFEGIVPFSAPPLPANRHDYILKVVTTLRDCLFVPRYYRLWNLFSEQTNFIPRRTVFETFLEHFTNTYNSAETDLLQIRLATGTIVTELTLRCIRFPLEELYLEFICQVHRLARNIPNFVKVFSAYFLNSPKFSVEYLNLTLEKVNNFSIEK